MLKKYTLLFLVLFFLSACTGTKADPVSETVYGPADVPEESQDPVYRYYDFEDIPIPKEMKISPKDSILFESQDIKAGMLSFTGRVDSESLFNYFQISMPNKGWRLISYIKYGTYILTFDKPNKLCIIRIIERPFSSELQIWISPKLSSIEYK